MRNSSFKEKRRDSMETGDLTSIKELQGGFGVFFERMTTNDFQHFIADVMQGYDIKVSDKFKEYFNTSPAIAYNSGDKKEWQSNRYSLGKMLLDLYINNTVKYGVDINAGVVLKSRTSTGRIIELDTISCKPILEIPYRALYNMYRMIDKQTSFMKLVYAKQGLDEIYKSKTGIELTQFISSAQAEAERVFKPENDVVMIDLNDDIKVLNGFKVEDIDKTSQFVYTTISQIRKIPLTKLVGQPPVGFQATGEADKENYLQTINGARKDVFNVLLDDLQEQGIIDSYTEPDIDFSYLNKITIEQIKALLEIGNDELFSVKQAKEYLHNVYGIKYEKEVK